MLFVQTKLVLVLSMWACSDVAANLFDKRAEGDSSFFTMILDALKGIEDDVAEVSSDLQTNGDLVGNQLTQLSSSIDGSKKSILESLSDIDGDISGAKSSLGQSLSTLDTKVVYVW